MHIICTSLSYPIRLDTEQSLKGATEPFTCFVAYTSYCYVRISHDRFGNWIRFLEEKYESQDSSWHKCFVAIYFRFQHASMPAYTLVQCGYSWPSLFGRPQFGRGRFTLVELYQLARLLSLSICFLNILLFMKKKNIQYAFCGTT